jgi:hypothetical protein
MALINRAPGWTSFPFFGFQYALPRMGFWADTCLCHKLKTCLGFCSQNAVPVLLEHPWNKDRMARTMSCWCA